MPENQKYTHRKKLMQKYKTKILIKLKIRDKKNSQKNSMGQFSGDNFPVGNFSGDIFPRTETASIKKTGRINIINT